MGCSFFVPFGGCATAAPVALIRSHHSGAKWCKLRGRAMAGDRTDGVQQLDAKRLSISVPHSLYQELEAQAARNNVSLAWVVRKALSEYLDRDIPLLRTGN